MEPPLRTEHSDRILLFHSHKSLRPVDDPTLSEVEVFKIQLGMDHETTPKRIEFRISLVSPSSSESIVDAELRRRYSRRRLQAPAGED